MEDNQILNNYIIGIRLMLIIMMILDISLEEKCKIILKKY